MKKHSDFIFAHELNIFRLNPQHISVHLVILHGEKRKEPALKRDWVSDRVYDYVDKNAALAFCAKLRNKYGGSIGPLRDKIEKSYKLVGARNRKRFFAMTKDKACQAILSLKCNALDWPEALPPGLDAQEVADYTGLSGKCEYWKGITKYMTLYCPRFKDNKCQTTTEFKI